MRNYQEFQGHRTPGTNMGERDLEKSLRNQLIVSNKAKHSRTRPPRIPLPGPHLAGSHTQTQMAALSVKHNWKPPKCSAVEANEGCFTLGMRKHHCPHLSITLNLQTQKDRYCITVKANVNYRGRRQAGSCPGREGDWKGAPGVQVLVMES